MVVAEASVILTEYIGIVGDQIGGNLSRIIQEILLAIYPELPADALFTELITYFDQARSKRKMLTMALNDQKRRQERMKKNGGKPIESENLRNVKKALRTTQNTILLYTFNAWLFITKFKKRTQESFLLSSSRMLKFIFACDIKYYFLKWRRNSIVCKVVRSLNKTKKLERNIDKVMVEASEEAGTVDALKSSHFILESEVS
jgi:hypothetical protein